jgi:hypothetical protein
MKTWRKYLAALAACGGMTPVAWAQVPAAPAAPAVAGAPAAAPAGTIWDKLGLSHDSLAKCKEKFCGSPLGQLVNNGLKPASALTGGILGCCPDMPTAAQLAAAGAEGDAAKIKKDEIEAKKRQAAVRYLGTVDCHWWPDAQKGLINALRADKNECVRHEAALALTRGCCCTQAVIEALTICVSGSEKDGNPSENSERVRMQAQIALTHCLECVPQKVDTDNKEKPNIEKPGGKNANGTSQTNAATAATAQLASYYGNEKPRTQSQIIEDARRALEAANNRSTQSAMLPTGSRSLADIWSRASAMPSGQETIPSVPVVAMTQGPAVAPSPALTPIPVTATERRIETPPAAQPEKYTGLLPALFRNTDSVPKQEPNWRPGTMSYVGTPTVATPTVATPTPAPAPALSPAPPSPRKDSVYQVMPRTATVSPARPAPASPAPASPAPAATEWLSVPKLLSVLKESKTPAQREWAADCLAGADCTAHPDVIPAVLSTAKTDASAIVRVACIHTLEKVHARGPDVVVD